MIPADAWDEGETIYIAAHALVSDGCEEETAWAGWTCDDGYSPEMEFRGKSVSRPEAALRPHPPTFYALRFAPHGNGPKRITRCPSVSVT
jgi:hypothetical protein